MNLQTAPLVEHLRELRLRLIRSLVGIGIGVLLCYAYSEVLMEVLRRPILPYLPEQGLIFTAPIDKFMAHIKVAVFGGIVLSCPWWLWQLWSFVAPALHTKEKRIASAFVGSGVGLFLAGVLFCYYLILPSAFEFLMTFGGTVDKPMIAISSYLSFVITMSLIFGLCFELPLVLVVLGILGIVSADFLAKKRRLSIVVLALASAILTPTPDAFSMILMLVPLLVLYEISILAVRFLAKPKSNLDSEYEFNT